MAQVLHQATQPKEQQDPSLCHFQQRGGSLHWGFSKEKAFLSSPRGWEGTQLACGGAVGLGKGASGPSLLAPEVLLTDRACEQSCRNPLAGHGPSKIPPHAHSPSFLCQVKEKLAAC